ncbi:MAG: magnesium transporter [Ruminococcus sp.]|nr:magnesium transporter [Ruminococcus sp.]MBQ1807158.1 magnesium transporter [Ruminococcus sp.]MBQ1945024.1 magnesium transporter [Ruminococcus sp.]MBQ5381594.1 magnesium transporter [Ruminococcus sp.]MBQ5628902.1 magnesium transporter [Ruminococcus sp.]
MTKEINNSPVTVEEAVAARPDYENEIIAVVRGTASPKAAQQKLEDYHGNDIAQAMASLTLPERKKLFRICTADMLAEAFEHLEEEDAVAYFNEMDVQKASAVTEKLDAETAVDILHGIEKEKRALIIDALPQDVRRDIRLLASFDEDEIGSKMTTDCVVLRENLSVPEAMAELVRQAEENDNIATIFVVDEDDEFYGAMELRDLITAKKETPLDDLIVTSFPYVYAHESIDDCIEKLKDYSEASVPVLDNGNKFLGIITAQSVIEVVDDEMGEDYAKLAGLTAEEDLKEPLLRSMQKRLPWLFALLGLGILVSTVVGAFEAVVQSLTMIMAFQSLILDMAGNVGTQSLAVTIRVLMDENLTFGQKMHLVLKESRVGFFNGLLLGGISVIFVGLYIALFKHKDFLFAFSVSGCIGISLVVAMVISSTVGTLIPLFFKKIKVDPAVASGPLITTINDLVAVVTYYGLSWVLLINWLQLGN